MFGFCIVGLFSASIGSWFMGLVLAVSKNKTSVASKANHKLAKDNKISLKQRNAATKVLRKVPYIGDVIAGVQLADAVADRVSAEQSKQDQNQNQDIIKEKSDERK